MDLNKVMLIGRLTRDPEARTTTTGRSVVNFTVATGRSWTDESGQRQEKTEFNNVVAWGKLADICSQYLNKGKQVYIEGYLQTRDWEGQDGVKRYRTEIVADNMIMLSGGGASGGSYNNAPQPQQSAPQKGGDNQEGEDEIKVEDIPF